MADVTSEARVVALDRQWPEDVAIRNGDLLDVVFGWPDFTRLRRLVAGQCAAAGLSGSRLDDFVLAVHEIAANAIVHAGTGGRLILRRAANGLRCLIADHEDPGPAGRVPRARAGFRPLSRYRRPHAGMAVPRRVRVSGAGRSARASRHRDGAGTMARRPAR